MVHNIQFYSLSTESERFNKDVCKICLQKAKYICKNMKYFCHLLTCLCLTTLSQVSDRSRLRWTPRLWNKDGLKRSWSPILVIFMLLTHDIDLVILLSAGGGLKLSALATAWSKRFSKMSVYQFFHRRSFPK